ncbi:MAG: YeeE/YedE family protein [Bradyrhizobiaceae bacterium]|nr:YeeE/YedE family protein [Bradyrhizobiaceae bacterium]
MTTLIASFVCGLVFGFGLLISGMTDPIKVLGFLDVFGRWDPTLAFVMAGATSVSFVGYAAARRQRAPLLAARSEWQTLKHIDAPLIGGAVLFGIGWGLAGVCPGPALVNLGTLSPQAALFVVAMVLGILVHKAWRSLERAEVQPDAMAKAELADG